MLRIIGVELIKKKNNKLYTAIEIDYKVGKQENVKLKINKQTPINRYKVYHNGKLLDELFVKEEFSFIKANKKVNFLSNFSKPRGIETIIKQQEDGKTYFTYDTNVSKASNGIMELLSIYKPNSRLISLNSINLKSFVNKGAGGYPEKKIKMFFQASKAYGMNNNQMYTIGWFETNQKGKKIIKQLYNELNQLINKKGYISAKEFNNFLESNKQYFKHGSGIRYNYTYNMCKIFMKDFITQKARQTNSYILPNALKTIESITNNAKQFLNDIKNLDGNDINYIVTSGSGTISSGYILGGLLYKLDGGEKNVKFYVSSCGMKFSKSRIIENIYSGMKKEFNMEISKKVIKNFLENNVIFVDNYLGFKYGDIVSGVTIGDKELNNIYEAKGMLNYIEYKKHNKVKGKEIFVAIGIE